MVATAAGNKVSKPSDFAWRRLEELQVEGEGEIQRLGTNKYILLDSCISSLFTSWHCLLKSQSILHGYLLSTYRCGIRILSAMVWSQGDADYTASPFLEHNYILELWYRVLEALLNLLLTRVIWSSQVDLSGSGSHELITLSLIH